MFLFMFILILLIIFTRSKIIIIFYFLFSLFNLVHHLASLDAGREGYSILTKEILEDEIVYAKIPLELSKLKFINFSDYFTKATYEQINQIGYFSTQGTWFSYINYLVFKLFGSSLFNLRFFNSLIMALLVGVFRKIFIEFNIKNSSSTKYAIFLVFMPNLIIRSIQFEKDIYVLFFIFYFLLLFIRTEKKYFLKKFLLLILLLLTRFYVAILLILSFVKPVKYLFFKKTFLTNLLYGLSAFSTLIFLLKIIYPSYFDYLFAIKSYSVLAGVTNIIDPNYDNFISTLITYIQSLYYYYFAPISIYTFQSTSNLFWKFLIIEPLLYSIIPLFYILLKNKIIKKDKRLLFFIGLSILIALTVLSFESHFTSIMRKRLPSLLLISITAIIVRYKSKNISI